MFELRDMTALVTGASRGIGRSIALQMAAAGAHVAATARSTGDLASLSEETMNLPGSVLSIEGDLACRDEIESIVERACNWNGRVDILVNSAGLISRNSAIDTTQADWAQTFRVNAEAPFFLMSAVGRHMLAEGGGSIVNIASIAGQVATGAPATYQASKAALIQLTRALAVEWSPVIRVNAVAPGYVRTALNAQWLSDPANEKYVLDRTPAGRLGLPEDVANAVVFLASPQAGFITGQVLCVDGGWTSV